jgi:hypothetical protein
VEGVDLRLELDEAGGLLLHCFFVREGELGIKQSLARVESKT